MDLTLQTWGPSAAKKEEFKRHDQKKDAFNSRVLGCHGQIFSTLC